MKKRQLIMFMLLMIISTIGVFANSISTFPSSEGFEKGLEYRKNTSLDECITPDAPVNLSAIPTGLTTADLSWTAGSIVGSPTVTYYWSVGTSSTHTYTSGYIARGTTTGTTASVTGLSCGTDYYLRVYAQTSCDGTFSSTATSALFTTAVPSAPTLLTSTPTTVCSGSTSQLNATSVGNTIHWCTAATGGTDLGTSASGADYAVTPSATTTYYAEAISGDGCSSATRTAVIVTVYSIFTSGEIDISEQTICFGDNPSIIACTTLASGGDGIITYSWRSSADSYVAAISGATSSTYTPPAGLATTTSYRRYAKDNTCNTTPEVSIGTYTVTVSPLPVISATSATPAILCAGGSSNLNATSVGYIIHWWTAATGGTDLGASASGADYAVTPLANTTYYAEATLSNHYYLRYSGEEPWGKQDNVNAMDSVFGSGQWTMAYFQSVDVVALLSSASFIFMDGSDSGADELEAFLTNNRTAIENWVSAGGALIINSAPNEGDGMSFGFGGTTLIYSSSSLSSVTAVDGTHDIFNGPYTPVGSGPFTGSSFSHAIVTGTGLTNLLINSTSCPLAEKAWGSGRVVFGGMTMPSFHSPSPNVFNLRSNLISYVSSCTNLFGCPSATRTPITVTVTSPPTVDLVSSDYIWSGGTSTDWNTSSNWLKFDGSDFEVASIPPTSTNNVIVRSYGTTCPSNSATISTATAYVKNMTIEASENLIMSNSQTINIGGDWINLGSFNAGNGRTIFNGSALQSVTNGGDSFYNVTFNNSSDINIEDPMTINGNAIFTNGIVSYVGTSGSLTFGTTATTTVTSNNSFVDGVVSKIGSSAFTFPTGDVISCDIGVGTQTYEVLGVISLQPVASTTVSAEYCFDTINMPDWWQHGGNMDATLHHVSGREHWLVSSSENLSQTSLKWYDNAHAVGSTCLHGFDEGDPSDFSSSDLTIAYWDGSMWVDAGGTATGSHDAGNVTSATLLPFAASKGTVSTKFITFGSKDDINPLPIELLYFKGVCENEDVLLSWETVSEINNDYFIVEKSSNLIDWKIVGSVQGAGNSSQVLDYSLSDENNGSIYYRLTQVDYDGEQETFPVITVICKDNEDNESAILIYPNPTKNYVYFSQVAEYELLTLNGKLLKKGYDNLVKLEGLASGVYMIRISNQYNYKIIKE